ncbi:TIGR00180 family glycosyltransferase [Paenibacillus polymyxa]|uniref:TIGR00180 family glycosyltransferase n=1 Tax=Paenibacillus polymyxa TaxID=1406 RepID=UPI00307DC809
MMKDSSLNRETDLLKKNIELLINAGDIENSKFLIAEFEVLNQKDIDIQNMKAIISMVENNYVEAEKHLWEGICVDPENADTLFNLAYLNELLGEYSKSINFFRQACRKTEDLQRKFTINQNIKKLCEVVSSSIDRKFIVFATCSLSASLQRVHHVSRALMELGHEVEYIEPLVEVTASNEQVTDKTLLDFSRRNIVWDGLVRVHTPVSAYFEGRYLLDNFVDIVQNLIDQSENEVVLICYLPSHVDIINQLSGRFKVMYECLIDHNDVEKERQIMEKADVITTTSTALYLDKYLKTTKGNVFLSKNAANINALKVTTENIIPDDLCNIPSPRICYLGTVDSWFDKELFYEVVRTNKDKSFVVIGPANEAILNEREDNLYILGSKEHSEIGQYLKHMRLGILPLKGYTESVVNSAPIKFYEYVISGLPVVSMNLPEMVINQNFVRTCNDVKEFNEAIGHFIENDVSENEIYEFANKNTWTSRCLQMISFLNEESQQHKKELVFKNLTMNWGTNINSNLILLSMYSLIIAEKDEREGLHLARKAYSGFSLLYTLKNYIRLLIMNNQLSTAIEVVLNDEKVHKKYKVELLYAIENDRDVYSILYFCIKDNSKIHLNEMDQQSVEYANYLYETGNINEALQIYWKNSQSNYHIHDSPMSSHNIWELLEIIKHNRSSYFRERYESLCEKYLAIDERESQLDLTFSKSVTVLVITRNRPHLLERCLKYFSGFKSIDIRIRVLDGSDQGFKDNNINLLQKYNFPNVIYYHYDNDLSPLDRITQVLDHVDEEYCAICADDDFLSEEGIMSSIKIMELNKDIVTVKGRSFIYVNDDTTKIFDFPRDSCESLLDDSPFERINKLTLNWVPQLIYLVFRKETLKIVTEMLKREDVRKLPFVFTEYLWYFSITLIGKVENSDNPLNFRDFSIDSEGNKVDGFPKFIADGTFEMHYAIFKSALVSLLEKSYSSEEIAKHVDQSMDLFLLNSWGLSRLN